MYSWCYLLLNLFRSRTGFQDYALALPIWFRTMYINSFLDQFSCHAYAIGMEFLRVWYIFVVLVNQLHNRQAKMIKYIITLKKKRTDIAKPLCMIKHAWFSSYYQGLAICINHILIAGTEKDCIYHKRLDIFPWTASTDPRNIWNLNTRSSKGIQSESNPIRRGNSNWPSIRSWGH